jgi:hypothetical protein
MGISKMSYQAIPTSVYYCNRTVLFQNAFVLAITVNSPAAAAGSAFETCRAELEARLKLGEAANALADFLRTHHFAACVQLPQMRKSQNSNRADDCLALNGSGSGPAIHQASEPLQVKAVIYTSIRNLPVKLVPEETETAVKAV